MNRPVLFRITNNLQIGGVQRRLASLLPSLLSDFEVHVVCYRNKGPFFAQLQTQGVQAHFLPIRHKWSLSGICRLAALLKKYKTDIVHTHSLGGNVTGILAAALAGVPVRIAQVHSTAFHWYGPTTWRRKKQALTEAMVHRLCRTQKVLCVSQETRQAFLQGTGLPRSTVQVLHNGIDFHELLDQPFGSGRAIRRSMGIEQDKKIIGLVGRLVDGKGLERIIPLARYLEDYRPGYYAVLVVGQGPLLEKIQRDIDGRSLKNTVFLAGEQERMGPFYQAFDLLFFPSPPGSEGMPGVVLEGCGAGLPVLARKAGTIEEIKNFYPWIRTFDQDTGFQDLAKEIETCLAMKPQKKYQPFVSHFSVQGMRNRTLDLYNDLLAEHWEK